MKRAMKLSDFNYSLDETLIAQKPLRNRDQARLMIIDRAKGTISHDVFSNLQAYLPEKSRLILNDSKVIPARLIGVKERTGGQVEIFLLKKLSDDASYETLMRPLKRLKQGDKVVFNGSRVYAEVVDKEKRIVSFNIKNVEQYLKRKGHIPLPPYIKRMDNALDRKYYQTIYAKKGGSVAAPTAGLHFTKRLLNKLGKEGHAFDKVTLHINYATFKPVEKQDITQHKMHIEDYEMSPKTFQTLKRSKLQKKQIVAVGTTSCRVLESVARTGKLKGSTGLFIYPGYRFKMVDALITNFHLPHSTLLMLVYAFGTPKLMRRAYQEAREMKYRFFSYGDAMLIL